MAKYLDMTGLQLLISKIKAADAATLTSAKTYVGSIDGKKDANNQAYTSVVAYLEDQISKAAESGSAKNVAIDDTANDFTATNVEAALAELMGKIKTLNGADDVAGSVAKAIADSIGDLDTPLNTENYTTVTAMVNGVAAEILKLIYGSQGSLNDLTTTAKGTVVAAINELDGEVGDLSTLTTDAKTDLVGAINEVDADIATLNGTGTGSVAKAIEDNAKDAIYKAADTANNKPAVTIADQLAAFETALGANGSVATQIENAINDLDANISSADPDTGKGVKVTVSQENGLVKTVTVAGDYSNAYDAKGAAAAVQGATTETVKSLKDTIDTYGDIVKSNVSAKAIGDADAVGTAIPTLAQVKAYVEALPKALVYKGIFADEAARDAAITAPENGDVAIIGTVEYIYNNSAWQVFGDETAYVKKTTTIAGVNLQSDITAAKLGEQLNLGTDYKLYYKNEADPSNPTLIPVTIKEYIDSRIFIGTASEIDTARINHKIDDKTLTFTIGDNNESAFSALADSDINGAWTSVASDGTITA